jgi:hypothetical protein
MSRPNGQLKLRLRVLNRPFTRGIVFLKVIRGIRWNDQDKQEDESAKDDFCGEVATWA